MSTTLAYAFNNFLLKTLKNIPDSWAEREKYSAQTMSSVGNHFSFGAGKFYKENKH